MHTIQCDAKVIEVGSGNMYSTKENSRLTPLMPWSPLPRQRAAFWGKQVARTQGNPHGLQRERESIERRDACKGVRGRVRSQRGIMLLGWGLDSWVMKRLCWRRLLLLCLRVRGATITGTRVGAMDDRVQLWVRPVLVVLLLSLLESRVLGRISTAQGVTAIRIRTLDHSQGSVT